jgi:hypothetical protein
MAAIPPTYVKGRSGEVTVVAGLDDTYTFQIKVGAYVLRFTNSLVDVSGFGDGGWKVFRGTLKEGTFNIAGWILTNGEINVTDLGDEITSAAFKLDGDTVKYVGDVRVESFEIDERYAGNVPVQLTGRFTGSVTSTT